LSFSAFSAHADQTCGRNEKGFVRCWGLNDQGQAPQCLGSLWPDQQAPANLASAGLFSDVPGKVLGGNVGAFQPRYKLWSDGSNKWRFVYVPECALIDNSDEDSWVLPEGTRLFKEFRVDGSRVETRMIQFTREDTIYAAYRWNADETVATLWDPETGELDAATYPSGVTHDIPSESECKQCHGGWGTGGIPARALGFSALQLSWPAIIYHVPFGQAVDMKTLSNNGWLTHPNPTGVTIPGDEITQNALGSLHANCGNCHNALGEEVRPDFDLWLSASDTDVTETGAWRTAVEQASIWYTEAEYRIAPGDPEDSAIFIRMAHRAADPTDGLEWPQMPPIGTKIVDEEGLAAVEAWIHSL